MIGSIQTNFFVCGTSVRLVPELGIVQCYLNSRSVMLSLDQGMFNKKAENEKKTKKKQNPESNSVVKSTWTICLIYERCLTGIITWQKHNQEPIQDWAQWFAVLPKSFECSIVPKSKLIFAHRQHSESPHGSSRAQKLFANMKHWRQEERSKEWPFMVVIPTSNVRTN